MNTFTIRRFTTVQLIYSLAGLNSEASQNTENNKFSSLVVYNPVKLETSRTVRLPLTKSVFSTVYLHK